MDKQDWKRPEVEKVIYSTLKMIVEDRSYFYQSTVDSKYSKLTDQGEQFVIKIFNEFLPLLQEVEQHELEERARDLTLTILSDKEQK
jgi:DNA-binding PadR family transcriptional regulator